jgi:hypothetical protein
MFLRNLASFSLESLSKYNIWERNCLPLRESEHGIRRMKFLFFYETTLSPSNVTIEGTELFKSSKKVHKHGFAR